jgi:3-oxoacid CoA-transferase A subunit
MKNKVLKSFDEAVADIPDGASIYIPGFAGPGTPRNLIAAVLRKKVKNLVCISNHPGAGPFDGQMDLGKLVEAGLVKKIHCCFTAAPHPSQATAFEKLHQQGLIEGELMPQGTLAERIRAAAAGIPAFYVRTGVGTEMAEGKERRVFDGQEYIMERALPADYAFIRAYRCDTFGNLQYRLSQRNFNPIMAMAAKTTIVEVEQEPEPPGSIDPDQVHTPGVFVHRIVKIPPASEGIWDRVVQR